MLLTFKFEFCHLIFSFQTDKIYNINIIFFQPEATEATDQPDASTKPAELDPAEIWKKDFQCQWYKTVDRDVSDQHSPKDGASVGGTVAQNAGDVMGSTTASTVASTTKGASATELRGSSSPGTASPKPSLEVTTDGGTNPLSAPTLTALLLLVAGSLCLEP